MNIKRGSIRLANLDPTIGSEIRKTRPVIVVSNDTNNIYNNVTTVLPVTSNTAHIFAFDVLIPQGIGNLPKESKAKADQIRAIDRNRLIKEIGQLPDSYLKSIRSALITHLDF